MLDDLYCHVLHLQSIPFFDLGVLKTGDLFDFLAGVVRPSCSRSSSSKDVNDISIAREISCRHSNSEVVDNMSIADEITTSSRCFIFLGALGTSVSDANFRFPEYNTAPSRQQFVAEDTSWKPRNIHFGKIIIYR